jgi:putative transposase
VPRSPRPQIAGGHYHVTSRGVERIAIFRSDRDRRLFLSLLQKTIERYGWLEFAYCLLSTHFHLVVQTPEPNIGRGMQYLLGRYAQAFNQSQGRGGHVVERRYDARVIESDRYLLEACRYVVLNPVRAELCRSAEDWPWTYCRFGVAETATAGV